MRVAFTLIGGPGWTGGINYLENLLSALSEYPACQISPILFAGTDVDPGLLARLTPFLAEPPILSKVWSKTKWIRLARMATSFGLQCDYFAQREFKRAKIDLVFQHQAWYGSRFGLPTLAWIADFQHQRLPVMFSKLNYYRRDLVYWALTRFATRLMVSSQDAKHDCDIFYPRSIGRVDVVSFAVRMGGGGSYDELQEVCSLYKLPKKFYFLPNQLWRHKNHLNVIEALKLLNQIESDVVIVASGNPKDGRNPDHPQRVLDLVHSYGLDHRFIFLGLIPFRHIMPMMRLSAAVINPSLFEGWSTTVEEAKAVGVPLLLSDLPIHREQTLGQASYFDPDSPENIAQVLAQQWCMLTPGPRSASESIALEINSQRRKEYAQAFSDVARRSIAASNYNISVPAQSF